MSYLEKLYRGYLIRRGKQVKSPRTKKKKGVIDVLLDGTLRKIFMYPPGNSHGRDAAYRKAEEWVDEQLDGKEQQWATKSNNDCCSVSR